MGRSCNLLFAVPVFILLHHDTSLVLVPNICTDEAALLALKSHISYHRNNIETSLLQPQFVAGLESLAAPVTFEISNNSCYGELPVELAHLQRLKLISVTGNNFAIPSFLREISVELDNLNKLQRLALTRNEFTGSAPAGIFNISTLQFLAFSENKLSGTVPSDLGRGMLILEKLYCAANILTGFISSSISNSWKLRIVDLSVNSFTGPIPESLGNLKYLEHLNLAGNTFFSETTFSSLTSLTNCRNLRVLSFGGNQLDSTFPTSVGNFSNSLQTFKAPDCKLKGNIPKEIGDLTGVIHMSLHYNELTWTYSKYHPKHIEPSRTLLKSNKIEGFIPDVICNLKNLGALDLSGNKLSGSVPPCIGNITSLRPIV
ncbi:hypothetical protein BC332_15110 [Capsicum chinense]|nr:hypothetical protein BC332_15110 [Capsicum chinense]